LRKTLTRRHGWDSTSADHSWYSLFRRLIVRGVIDDEGLPSAALSHIPGMLIRRLISDEQVVWDWVKQNWRAIESIKARGINAQIPQVMLVLQECRSNTWARLSWRNISEINRTKVAGLAGSCCPVEFAWRESRSNDSPVGHKCAGISPGKRVCLIVGTNIIPSRC